METDNPEVITSNLKVLNETYGWKYVKFYFQGKLDYLKHALNTGNESDTIEDIKLLRAKIKMCEELIELPDRLIRQLSNKDEEDSFWEKFTP